VSEDNYVGIITVLEIIDGNSTYLCIIVAVHWTSYLSDIIL